MEVTEELQVVTIGLELRLVNWPRFRGVATSFFGSRSPTNSLLTSTSNEYRISPLHTDNNSEVGSFLREEMGRACGRLITRLFPTEEIFQTFDYLYFSLGTINLYLTLQNVSTK